MTDRVFSCLVGYCKQSVSRLLCFRYRYPHNWTCGWCCLLFLFKTKKPCPLLFTTLAGLLGWRCLFRVSYTRCGVRTCEMVEMRETREPLSLDLKCTFQDTFSPKCGTVSKCWSMKLQLQLPALSLLTSVTTFKIWHRHEHNVIFRHLQTSKKNIAWVF